MKIEFNAPVVFTRDIAASCSFYRKYLHQEILYDFGANVMFKSHLSLWQLKPEYEVSAVAGNPKHGNTFELYFETDDIATSLEHLKSAGVEFLHELKTEPWGQQTFRFFDPDHHLVEIGERMEAFITRVFEESGSVEATCQRTGVPEETVRTFLRNPES